MPKAPSGQKRTGATPAAQTAKRATGSLRRYAEKRNFQRTPEPAGKKLPGQGRALRFVVQKHRATRLHYDFRLEADGVLKSWAVPKGPSLNPVDRRLAMQVEDHPYDYRDFEGVIPAGNYGAGEVIVWDRGTYKLAEGTDAALEIGRGKIKFILKGKKLTGMFTLVRMRGRNSEENAWLLVKDNDAGADPEWNADDHAESVKSGRTLDDIARGRRVAQWISNRPAASSRR
ncbi:MAG: 3'-phosphoesterase [Candidatus Eremiobacter antarcticus]|nr:3'-phosphoesterase [Candidatus Eremiobacteraeota bacterium]MBC5808982.1 3'-phosphoesterase [Candidatus Eremiobacteraeota bacterium]PZR60341.1 MAG: 3'-phosphoesterase [Candidatus Eremiobacter sp. RRmetagenome_bin22]